MTRKTMTSKPTIYQALATKLGREPTRAEVKADVKRILDEVKQPNAAQWDAETSRFYLD